MPRATSGGLEVGEDGRGGRLVAQRTAVEAAGPVRDRPQRPGVAEQLALGHLGVHGGRVAVGGGVAAGDAGASAGEVRQSPSGTAASLS